MKKTYLTKITLLLFLIFLSIKSFSQQLPSNNGKETLDRFAIVNRHNVVLHQIDPLAAMTLGNGDFAFTADVTGMQSLEEHYYDNGIPLETRTTWAWHSFPNPNQLQLKDAMKEVTFHDRKILYASLQKSEAGDYYRKNPHPIAMGQISLRDANNQPLKPEDIQDINQKLDIWKGQITSQYKMNGHAVSVETVSHPDLSLVAFNIKSDLLKSGKLKPTFRFPYAYDLSKKNKPPLDWTNSDQHQTTIISKDSNSIVLKRSIDTSVYFVNIHWKGKAKWEQLGPHEFTLDATGNESLELVCEYTSDSKKTNIPTFNTTQNASAESWKQYWTKGGIIDLSESKDSRAKELERRTILSLYLMKVNYSGSFPPQETGLANISWYGKHNSEVYWIHAAQFYQWNHTDLLEKGLSWYNRILPTAMADAKSKGFDGARWPKMSGINGRISPGDINPFIIWNASNPIYLSELVYRAHPNAATLNTYQNIVFESAKFLASYAWYDNKTDRYILGPPIKSVNESTEENSTINPTFELAQWYYGLKVAQNWRERLGMKREVLWDDILNKLSKPTIQDGKYVELESDPNMYDSSRGFSSAMLMALGYLPETEFIDKQIMQNTFQAILERNGLNSFVSWSMGKGALTAARLGDPEIAVDIVTNDSPKAHFNKTGYVPRAKEGINNPCYLPVNGAFLAAVGLMAAGWDHSPKEKAPGFPKNGEWVVRSENLLELP